MLGCFAYPNRESPLEIFVSEEPSKFFVKVFFDGIPTGMGTYKNLLRFWLFIYKSKQDGSKLEHNLTSYGLDNPSVLDTDLDRIVDSFTLSSILDFAMKLPTYKLTLWYVKDASTKIPFKDASYGQQAGSILTNPSLPRIWPFVDRST